jgi:hypothetical protein
MLDQFTERTKKRSQVQNDKDKLIPPILLYGMLDQTGKLKGAGKSGAEINRAAQTGNLAGR